MDSTRFTKQEEGVIRQALDSNEPALLRTSRELHGFAQQYNWDNGTDAMFKLIRHPLCDRGTALMVYWRAQPLETKEYPTRQDAPAWYRDIYDLVQEIEARMQVGGFAEQNISYGPVDDEMATDDTEARAPTSSPISEMMWRRSPGIRLIPPFTVDKVLRSLNERERAEFERKLARAAQMLSEAGHPVSAQDKPGDIVRAIGAAAVTIRESIATGKNPARFNLLTAFVLQSLWNEQLCRCGRWRWLIAEPYPGGPRRPEPQLVTTDLKWTGIFNEVRQVIEWSSGTWRKMFDADPSNAGKTWDGQITRRFDELRSGAFKRRHKATGEIDIFPLNESWTFLV